MSSPSADGVSADGSIDRRGRRAKAIGGATLAAAAILLLGCWLIMQRPAEAPAQPRQRLAFAVPSTPHAALVHLAIERGFFAAEGLDVDVKQVTHGKLALELLAEGKADLAAAAELPFVVQVMNGREFALLASVASATSEMAVIARRDRAIDKPADLAGKKIGVTRGTSGEYFLWAFLIRHRLGPDAVTLVDGPPARLDRDLADGRVDAIAAWQPTRFRATAALGDGGIALIEPDAYTATYVVVGNRTYLREHPRVGERVLRALLQAEALVQAEPRYALQLVAQRMGVPVETLLPGWQDQDFRVDLLQPQLITLEDEASWAVTRGYAQAVAAPNFLSHLHLDALIAVRPERVTVVH